jgi:hypothetical protein
LAIYRPKMDDVLPKFVRQSVRGRADQSGHCSRITRPAVCATATAELRYAEISVGALPVATDVSALLRAERLQTRRQS